MSNIQKFGWWFLCSLIGVIGFLVGLGVQSKDQTILGISIVTGFFWIISTLMSIFFLVVEALLHD